MATIDANVKRHQDTYNGFTKFLFWSTLFVVILLVLMAFFLL